MKIYTLKTKHIHVPIIDGDRLDSWIADAERFLNEHDIDAIEEAIADADERIIENYVRSTVNVLRYLNRAVIDVMAVDGLALVITADKLLSVPIAGKSRGQITLELIDVVRG